MGIKTIKRVLKSTPIYSLILNARNVSVRFAEIQNWKRRGRLAPPPHSVKQRVLRHYARKYKLRILVETGTYYGDMVEAMKNVFQKIYSIELSHSLFIKAKERFEGVNHVHLLEGDSSIILKELMRVIEQPVLFWLDGHYSAGVTDRGVKDTPISEELDSILNADERRHVIIIDDAHCFGADPAYPTIDELKEKVFSKRQDMLIQIRENSIRITPG